jgi:uncharacterized protein YprB with RNaseH-like and TPR domain
MSKTITMPFEEWQDLTRKLERLERETFQQSTQLANIRRALALKDEDPQPGDYASLAHENWMERADQRLRDLVTACNP